MAEAIPRLSYIEFHHQANNRSKYADGRYTSMIHDKNVRIPSPMVMVTCTALRLALMERQKAEGVHPKDSKSKLKVDRPDHSSYFTD
jgi:hypothetical protein